LRTSTCIRVPSQDTTEDGGIRKITCFNDIRYLFVSNEWLNQHPGFADSLRKKSFNKSIFNAVVELFPKDAKLEIFEMEGSSSSLDSSLFIATTTH
jgi:hypothetical protein